MKKYIKLSWLVLALVSLIFALTTSKLLGNTAVGITLLITSPLGLAAGYGSTVLLTADDVHEWSWRLRRFIMWFDFYAGGFIQWFVLVPLLKKQFKRFFSKQSEHHR